MPSTIVKLCSGDARAWRVNQPIWLDEQGRVERAVLPEEQLAISTCLARTARVEQSFQQELELKKPHAQGRPPQRLRQPVQKATFAFEVLWVGNRRTVNVYLGHLRYATGREVLSARLLADHGEAILHGPNGKCMGVLRDPFVLEREPNRGKRVQRSVNPEEQAQIAARQEELRQLEEQRQARLRQRQPSRSHTKPLRRLAPERVVAAPAVRAIPPEKCPNDCRGYRGGGAWVIPKDAPPIGERDHNTLCMHAVAWKAAQKPQRERMVIYDLDTSTVMREAIPSEVAEAEQAKQKTGVSQVQLQNRVFAVLREEDARAAALEARGEDPTQAAPSPDYATSEASASPSSSDVLDDAEPEDDPVSEPPDEGDEDAAVAAPDAKEQERGSWPTLDEIAPSLSGRRSSRSSVTAGDYLARRASPEASTG